MLGGILLKLAFAGCLLSVLFYYRYHRRGDIAAGSMGRTLYYATAALIAATAGVLLWLILTHQFQFTYVWSYSSRELDTPLLVSTLYAGQEGSFLLWALYTSVIGVFLLRYTARRGHEAAVMVVYSLITLVLLLLLIVKNPFLYVWETWPGDVDAGFLPANGRGLNPLLQNYWMVIHPQILFTGFAAMGVPFAYAVAAMLRREHDGWIRPATPWMVFGALQLGTGIMMGGFWAYETLGWGGYWGWDPVENSSLVPWLTAIAAIHTLLSQRKTGAFVRTNLVLAMLCYLLVLYSTFLTRSGVLGDTSVHSFVDPGMWVYWLLVGTIAVFALLGFGLFVRRLREFPRVPSRHTYLSRESALTLGAGALLFSALFIVAGTSSPIITGIVQGRTTAVDFSYYVTTTLPLAIAVAVLSGLGQLLWWTRSPREAFGRTLTGSLALSAAITGLLVLAGMRDGGAALLVFASLFSLSANTVVGWRIIRGNPRFAGGAVAHIGVAIMFLGFVSTSVYDREQVVSLPQGKPVDALGYTLTYLGYRPIDGERFRFEVDVEGTGGGRHVIGPVMYFSTFTNGLIRTPDIANFITHDFYLAPVSLEQPSGRETVQLPAGGSDPTAGLDILMAEASVKPYINLVWSGVLILMLGFIITLVRRGKDAAVA